MPVSPKVSAHFPAKCYRERNTVEASKILEVFWEGLHLFLFVYAKAKYNVTSVLAPS